MKTPALNPDAYSRLNELNTLFKSNPNEFYLRAVADRLSWFKKPTQVSSSSFRKPVQIRWFDDGILNVSYNCLDRHLPEKKDQVAFYFEPDDPEDPFGQRRPYTYQDVFNETCLMAQTLLDLGVRQGDRVTIYLPMIPEAIFAVLACSRIGAIHSVVFAGFSSESLRDRIVDAKSQFLITADVGKRGRKEIPLGELAKRAVEILPQGFDFKWSLEVTHPSSFSSTANRSSTHSDRAIYSYEALRSDLLKKGRDSLTVDPVHQNAEDPLFLLYTSGSTGKPKGVLHTAGGYLAWASFTHDLVFDLKPHDIYWCTADIGWITGHSYLIYGPLANGATSVLYEGVPNSPDCSRIWNIVDRYSVSTLYTAPTAIRALMREGDQFVKQTSRASLRVLGTVGEPINPEAWRWYFEVCGNSQAPVVDTWWQTETGGILISACAYASDSDPGSAGRPLPGVQPVLIDSGAQIGSTEAGPSETTSEPLTSGEGHLCLAQSWPGQMRTVYGDHQRFEETYFSTYPGYYFTGDGARLSEDGQFTITGRVDDVLNVAGHRLGTAEIESALVAHPAVSEAAVVGFPHSIKGQGIYCFVSLKEEAAPSEALKLELIQEVRKHISAIATPDAIQWAQALPKTRSGKIMRRILRKIAEAGPQSVPIESLGDISTLADPGVVDRLVKERVTAVK